MTAVPSRSGRLSGPAQTNGREPPPHRQSSRAGGAGPTLRDPRLQLLSRLSGRIAAALAIGALLAGCSALPWHKSAPKQQISAEEKAKLEAHLADLRAELAERQAQTTQQAQAQPASPPTADEANAQRAKLQARLDTLKAEVARREAAAEGKLGARAGAEDLFSGRARAAAIADEPQAAIIGRMALESGGSAADAAAAMYFALSVTHPAAASLGGGGICLVRSANGRVDSLDFLARAPAGGGSVAIPGNLAGIAALQSHYGVMRWAAVILPAERLAGAGTVTRTLSHDIAALPADKMSDPALQSLAWRTSGQPRLEGDSINRPDLAMTLMQISAGGVNAFYSGALGRAFIRAANANGGAITPNELRDYAVKIAPADAFDLNGTRIFVPSLATGAGQLAAETLSSARGTTDRSAIDAAVKKSLDALGAPESLPADFGSTSFLAADTEGRAVACAVTMNGPFGALASSDGIIMAKNPATSPEGYGNAFLDPMIASGAQTQTLHAVASASNGPSSLASIIEAMGVSRASPKRSARDILSSMSSGGATGNLFTCRPGNKHECSAASDPTRSGLAGVIVGK